MARKKQWVEALLTKREAIERAIGMPLGTMLGCGHWGCVFESTPPWVVKLSIDPTEGPIWSKITDLVEQEQYGGDGFPKIKSLHRITPDHAVGGRKRKVWAIVREGIEPVFREYRARELGMHGGGTILATSEFTNELLALPRPERATSLPYGHPGTPREDIRVGMEALIDYRLATTAWHGLQRTSRSRAEISHQHYFRSEYGCAPGDGGWAPNITNSECLDRIASKIERILHRLNGPLMGPLGESLSMLASNGVYLRDVHLLNIGWHIAHGDDDWTRVVIFDPGHTPTESGGDIEQVLVEEGREAL
jgi:hypothetical protein